MWWIVKRMTALLLSRHSFVTFLFQRTFHITESGNIFYCECFYAFGFEYILFFLQYLLEIESQYDTNHTNWKHMLEIFCLDNAFGNIVVFWQDQSYSLDIFSIGEEFTVQNMLKCSDSDFLLIQNLMPFQQLVAAKRTGIFKCEHQFCSCVKYNFYIKFVL